MNTLKICVVAIFILIFLPYSGGIHLHGISNETEYPSLVSGNDVRAMVYILPYEKCNEYWTKTYGDRIYYYAYGNLTKDRELIEKDFEIISTIYDTVIVVIPAEDNLLYFKNLEVINDVAEEFNLKVLYAIFPKEKYGQEDTYLDKGSKMHDLVITDMQYLASMHNTYKVAIWYGWSYRCNATDIVNFYNSLPSLIKSKYAVWLDEEYAERVKDVYIHGLPYDVLFVTEAYDKEEVASYSYLYYNQILVTGYEGAESLKEWRENIENMLSVCRTDDVGIWIFYDIGDGAGEEYAAFIDGKLTDFNFSAGVPFQKGFSYAAWWNNSYLINDSDASLENLKETGTEYVSLITTWYQENEHSTQIMPDKDATPSDDSIIHAIEKIHSLGMKVMLKPHVDLYNEEWRGEINFSNDKQWEEWFNSYKEFICHYAKIAEENNVEIFCIGCELVKTVNRKEWIDIIDAVRENFSGIITYAANWDNYRNVSFWNFLDFVGIDAYFPLTDKNDPTLEELLEGWKKWKHDMERFHNETEKPVIFTEIGYRSIDGCNRDPWNWQRHGKIDLQEQADCYEAAFKTFWNKSWFYGFYWWMWWTTPDKGGSNDDSYTPYKKPAEEILRKYYLGVNLTVEIIKPKDGMLYVFDREIMQIGRTLIIGRITIEVNATYADKVEFYVDNELKYTDYDTPYEWQWNEFAIGIHEIKVIAYDDKENKEEDKINIVIFNIV